MDTGLIAQRRGAVLHLVLDAPGRRNALSRAMLSALADALGTLDADLAGVVISGTGATFSAGADFADLTGTVEDLAYDDDVSRVRDLISHGSHLIVAAIEGPCLGAAADLALACDVRIMAADGYLQVPATRLGLLYNPVALARLVRIYPVESVRRLVLLGERLSADTAERLGLVTQVAEPGGAVAAAEALLTAGTVSAGPAVSATKAFLAAHIDGDDGLGAESGPWQRLRRDLLASPERSAAVAAARQRHARPDHVNPFESDREVANPS